MQEMRWVSRCASTPSEWPHDTNQPLTTLTSADPDSLSNGCEFMDRAQAFDPDMDGVVEWGGCLHPWAV